MDKDAETKAIEAWLRTVDKPLVKTEGTKRTRSQNIRKTKSKSGKEVAGQ